MLIDICNDDLDRANVRIASLRTTEGGFHNSFHNPIVAALERKYRGCTAVVTLDRVHIYGKRLVSVFPLGEQARQYLKKFASGEIYTVQRMALC